MRITPGWYASWRAAVGFDEVSFGVGGIRLLGSDDVPRGQVGYSVASDGEPLAGADPGQWQREWLVIGEETACGDPIFILQEEPHAVFTAIHGEGAWEPQMIAPSLDTFRQCLEVFRRFAHNRSNPVELESNSPTDGEQAQFLDDISRLTGANEEAVAFWAVQVDIDLPE